MTLSVNGNILKAGWLVGVLLSIIATLGYIGYSANERRVSSLEDWRINHEAFVSNEMRQLTRQLTTIEEEIKWIRREMEDEKKRTAN